MPLDLLNRVLENTCARGSALILCSGTRVCRSVKKSGLDANVGAIVTSIRPPQPRSALDRFLQHAFTPTGESLKNLTQDRNPSRCAAFAGSHESRQPGRYPGIELEGALSIRQQSASGSAIPERFFIFCASLGRFEPKVLTAMHPLNVCFKVSYKPSTVTARRVN